MSTEMTIGDALSPLNTTYKILKGIWKVGKFVNNQSKPATPISKSQVVYGDNNTFHQSNK